MQWMNPDLTIAAAVQTRLIPEDSTLFVGLSVPFTRLDHLLTEDGLEALAQLQDTLAPSTLQGLHTVDFNVRAPALY